MRRVLLSNDDNPAWASLGVICPNLELSYLKACPELKQFTLNFSFQKFSDDTRFNTGWFLHWSKSLKKLNPQQIIIKDSHWLTPTFITALSTVIDPRKVEWVIHIFGDFTVFTGEWTAVASALSGAKVKWVVASERQKIHFGQFLLNPGSSISIAPFPVDSKNSFDLHRRKSVRKNLKLGESEKLILYTGRMSQQKNTLALIEIFADLRKIDAGPPRLLLVGGTDDIGSRMLDLGTLDGYFFYQLQKLLKSLPKNVRDRIEFLPNQSRDILRGLYDAADLFFSPSTYHDEDYGMSPAEALSHGSPCLLTDWAGYSSFAVPGALISYIPVRLGSKGLQLHRISAMNGAKKLLSLADNPKLRSERANRFAKVFGISGVANTLTEIIQSKTAQPFMGFNSKFRRLIARDEFPLVPSQGSNYLKYYDSYLGPTDFTGVKSYERRMDGIELG